MTTHFLDARGVAVSFHGRPVLDRVDIHAPGGQITGVTGPSGCGKTTLLRILAGLRRPDAGKVTYNGAAAPGPGEVAMLAQHPRQVCNPRWRLADIVAEPVRIRRESAGVDSLAERVGLDRALLDRYPGQVSDGQLQRACLARVLAQQARFVLCDEPTAMLDPIAAGDVAAQLRDLAAAGAVVVLVSHDPQLVAAVSSTTLEL